MLDLNSVLITGCSAGGIGSALALEFQSRGFHVFATGRNLDKLAHLAPMPHMTLLELDVTSEESVSAAAATVARETGGSLDVLVNNAGRQILGAALDVPLAQARAVFDVNLFGVLLVTQAFTPLLVQSRDPGGGCIVNMCSISGYLHNPYLSIYQASKAAVEMLSETLRLELRPLGIRVISLVTGLVESNIRANAGEVILPESSHYLAVKDDMKRPGEGRKRTPANEFAQQVVSDVLAGKSGRIWRGSMAGTIRLGSKFVPAGMVDSTLEDSSGLSKVTKK